MAKPKLSLVLPAIQVVITLILTVWADRLSWLLGESKRPFPPHVRADMFVLSLRLIWRGVNAPTWPLCMAVASGQGFSALEAMYFAAVGVLWYLVGRFLENRNQPKKSASKVRTIFYTLMFLWGLTLLVLSLANIHDISDNSFHLEPETVIGIALFLAWALALLTLAAGTLFLGRSTDRAS